MSRATLDEFVAFINNDGVQTFGMILGYIIAPCVIVFCLCVLLKKGLEEMIDCLGRTLCFVFLKLPVYILCCPCISYHYCFKEGEFSRLSTHDETV
jgi:hypothetical protein